MGINVSGLTDGEVLGYATSANALSARYGKLKEALNGVAGGEGILRAIEKMEYNLTGSYKAFIDGYSSDGGKTYKAIENEVYTLGDILDNLYTEAKRICDDCDTRIKFYNSLHDNILAARQAVSDKYSEKELKSDWHLISNTYKASQNEKARKEKANIRYSIVDNTVSYS